jgi:CBS domain containing-hemolysin-like protein
MEWLTDPAVWVGLLTLVVLEIVLGVDNLVFIAILADRVSPEQRDRARLIGLSLALFMRLGLLASISWVTSLTTPVFTLLTLEISWRDLILIAGGLFLLVKATIEIHDRLEAEPHAPAAGPVHAGFWSVVAQILVLDAVFSLDSVITAVGMVDELYVMMAAVVIAVLVMLAASKPLTRFVGAHPSLVILCLGFLLMIGLVLVADGLGYHLPKGYVYAAIGFSVMIETFNQMASRNRRKQAAAIPPRQRVTSAVLRLLGGVPLTAPAPLSGDVGVLDVVEASKDEVFAPVEKRMVRGVLALADRPVRSIMTPRSQVAWIDAEDSRDAILATVRRSPHRLFVVGRGSLDAILGVARKENLLDLALGGAPFDVTAVLEQPPVVHAGASVLDVLNLFKKRPVEMALIIDEYGGLQGIATRTDLLEAIAGDFPDAGDEAPEVKPIEDGTFEIDGAMSIEDAREQLGVDSLPEGDFDTVAGLLLSLFGRVPSVGERICWHDWTFEVSGMNGWRIGRVRARRSGVEATPEK